MQEYTFELPKGYVDAEGNVHRGVTLREITGADQEAMLNPALKNNPAKMLSALLARVILRVGDVEKAKIDSAFAANLTKTDRDFLILKLKEMDSGPDLDMDVECPSCGHKFKASMDVGDFFGR